MNQLSVFMIALPVNFWQMFICKFLSAQKTADSACKQEYGMKIPD
jgi:hypothetical protein